MKKIITTTLIAFIAISVSAQITIEATNLLNAGDLIMQSYDSVAQDPGASGGSQTWDLTGMNSNDMDTILFSSPTGFPGFSLFPDANIGLEDDSTWIFIKKASSEFTYLGTYEIFNNNPDTQYLDRKWLNFPATLGSQLQGTLFSESQADSLGILGVDSFRFTTSTGYKAEIDGWGVAKTPAGNWDALRQKVDYNTSAYVDAKMGGVWAPMSAALLNVFNIDTGVIFTSTSYRYWGNDANAKFMIASVDTGDSFDGNNYLIATPSGPPTGIYMTEELPEELSIYPNPVINNLNIDISSENGKAILTSVLGQTMATKLIYKGQNKLDLNNFKNGTYILEIKDENGETIKSEKIQVNK